MVRMVAHASVLCEHRELIGKLAIYRFLNSNLVYWKIVFLCFVYQQTNKPSHKKQTNLEWLFVSYIFSVCVGGVFTLNWCGEFESLILAAGKWFTQNGYCQFHVLSYRRSLWQCLQSNVNTKAITYENGGQPVWIWFAFLTTFARPSTLMFDLGGFSLAISLLLCVCVCVRFDQNISVKMWNIGFVCTIKIVKRQ